MTYFTCVRAERIRDRLELSRIASHGRRRDPTGKRRADPERTPFNPAGSAYADDPLDLTAALDAFLVDNGAALYGRKPIGLHVLVSVSPGWVREAGDLHDPGNARNVELAKEAVAWVESALGGDAPCVFAWRQDLDETGGGVIDIFAAPTRVARLNGRAEKRIVSVAPSLKALHGRYPGDATEFGALQSAWAEYARSTLDADLSRGVRRADQPATHLDPDRYGRFMDAAKAEAAVEADRILVERQADLDARERDLIAAEARAAEREAALRRAKAEAGRMLAEQARGIEARERDLASAEAQLQVDKREIAVRARRSVTAAVDALALGVQAFVDGRIAAVEPDPETGRPVLVQGVWVESAEWDDLLAALGPGWPAGLMAALEHLQTGTEQVVRAGRLQPGWSPRP